MRRSEAPTLRVVGLVNFAPLYFPSRALLVPHSGAHNSRGEGECRERPKETLFVLPLSEPPVIALSHAGPWARFFLRQNRSMAGARRTFGPARSYYLKIAEGASQSLWLSYARGSQIFCDWPRIACNASAFGCEGDLKRRGLGTDAYNFKGRSCANLCRCPRPRPSTMGVGRSLIGLSEACSSVGQLEARAAVGLALAPLPKNEREGGIAGCHETVMRGWRHPGMIKRIRISGWRRASFMKLEN